MIRAKTPQSDIIIDLTGPYGNAFYLLRLAKDLAHQRGWSASAITIKMCSGDYEHLIQIFDQYFGDVVILER